MAEKDETNKKRKNTISVSDQSMSEEKDTWDNNERKKATQRKKKSKATSIEEQNEKIEITGCYIEL